MTLLVRPSKQYKNSFIDAVREFQKENRYININIESLPQDFTKYINDLIIRDDISKLKEGRVPETYFWLVNEDEFIGRISIRHKLVKHLFIDGHIGYEIRPSERKKGYGKKILELGLKEAKKLGLQRVLVTCDSDNIGSKRIIKCNGGKFEDEVLIEGKEVSKLRYWFNLE